MNWDKLVEENSAALVLYARQWCKSHADAQDAVQDGFIRFARSFPEEVNNPVPYLYKAVRWSALDRLRQEKRRSVREETGGELLYPEDIVFDDSIEQGERAAEIQKLLEKLPPEQREVVVMKIWGGQTFKNIATALDIPANTAASRYRYALESMKSRIGSNNHA
jgi:RNA polymerase sigma-70 factor (ECF subfamily)